MKKNTILLLIGCLISCQTLVAQHTARKKVGVVLSGGGAKGAAHIGVLKAIEEAGIPIDYIAGTSMGAVIGGLYALGYTPAQLDSLIKGQDWEFLLSDNPARKKQTVQERDNSGKYLLSVPLVNTRKPEVGGLVRGRNLANLLSKLSIGYHDSISFDRLPIPFACVATNIVDGQEIVFRSGKIATAIRASMAIPGAFTPVKQNKMVLVDGGLVNNYPVDVARSMGADIIIGATVQSDLPTAENINNVSDILSQLITISCRTKFEQNIKDSDLHLHVDTKEYTMMDFKPEVIDSMIHRGWTAAQRHQKELAAIREELYADGEEHPIARGTSSNPMAQLHTSVLIGEIAYHTGNRHEIKTVTRKCRIKENQPTDIAQIEEAVRILQDEFNYPDAYYTLTEEGEKYRLDFYANQKNESSFSVGARFDTEEILSAIVNGELFFKTSLPSSLSVTGKIGKQYMARLDYNFEPFLHRSLNVAYEFKRNDMNIYQKGRRQYNLVFREHAGEIKLTDQSVSNLQCEIGMRVEYYNYDNILTDQASTVIPELKEDVYFNYFVTLKYNSQDRSYYPTRGSDFRAGYTLYTDNLTQYGGESPISAVHASWRGAFSVNSHFTILPAVGGRVLFDGNIAPVYSNVIGGNYAGKYISHQLPFVGIHNTERVEKAIVMGGLTLRQRIKGEHYLSLLGNVAVSNDKAHRLNDGTFIYGIGLQYGYNTKLGPVEASVSYTNNSEKVTCFINLGYYF